MATIVICDGEKHYAQPPTLAEFSYSRHDSAPKTKRELCKPCLEEVLTDWLRNPRSGISISSIRANP